MSASASQIVLYLIGPGTFLLFFFAFVWAWVVSRRHYLLLVAACCLLSSTGAITRAMMWPADIGLNVFVSNTLYTGSTLACCEGVLRRYGRKIGLGYDLAILATSISLMIWFYYVDQNFEMRVYIQNFGSGVVFLASALSLWHLARGRLADRAVFWVFLLFGVQFFPRTLMTLAMTPTPDMNAFADSVFWQALQLSNAVFGTALALTILGAELSDAIDGLRLERDVDRLSGVLNRRGFEERVGLVLGQRTDAICTLVLCDIDHFKRINDTYGHRVGDEVLHRFGELLREGARPTDVLGRIGGEEFALLFPGVGLEETRIRVARLQDAISGADFSLPAPLPQIAASFGVSACRPSEPFEATFDRADAALYRAKEEGRNRAVFVAPEPAVGAPDSAVPRG